jgi:hypothetical protein
VKVQSTGRCDARFIGEQAIAVGLGSPPGSAVDSEGKTPCSW